MRITALETVRVEEIPNLLLLRVKTDEDLVGLGETYFGADSVEAYLHGPVAEYLLGSDPTRVAEHARCLSAYVGTSGTGTEMRGNSAVDLALWDLRAKVLGVPLFELLGGRVCSGIWAYNTCAGPSYMSRRSHQEVAGWGLGDPGGTYEDLDGFLHRPVELAKSLLSEGICGMKIWPFDLASETSSGQRLSLQDLDQAMEPFHSIRDALGSSMELLVELHGSWNLSSAKRILAALEEVTPFWVEDPVAMEDSEALAWLRGSTPLVIAGGETLGGHVSFRRLIESGSVDIVIADLSWSGGLTAATKVATMADAHQLGVAPHDCTGPVSFACSVHFSLATPNSVAQELVRAFYHGWYSDLVEGLPLLSDGRLDVAERPGHGVELRPEALERAGTSQRRSELATRGARRF